MEISDLNDWIKFIWFFIGGLIFCTATVVTAWHAIQSNKKEVQSNKEEMKQLWTELKDHQDECGEHKKQLSAEINDKFKDLHHRFDEIISYLLGKK